MEIITAIISFLSATVVAYFGYLSAKREKADKEYRSLQEQLSLEKQKAEDKEKEEQIEEMSRISDQLQNLSNTVDGMKNHLEEIDNTVNHISALSKFNVEYSAEINNALLLLGSSMIAENPDRSAVSKQLMEHQTKTNKMQSAFFKMDF